MLTGWHKVSGANSYFYSNGHCAVGQVTGLTKPVYDPYAVGAIVWNLSWSRVSGASGYETAQSYTYYDTSKKKYAAWSVPSYTTDVGSATSSQIGMQNTVLCRLKVRAYAKVNGKRAYGPWSSWSKSVGFDRYGNRVG